MFGPRPSSGARPAARRGGPAASRAPLVANRPAREPHEPLLSTEVAEEVRNPGKRHNVHGQEGLASAQLRTRFSRDKDLLTWLNPRFAPTSCLSQIRVLSA